MRKPPPSRAGTARCAVCGTYERAHAELGHEFVRKAKQPDGVHSTSFSGTEIDVLDRVLVVLRGGGTAEDLAVLRRNPAFRSAANKLRACAEKGD